MFKHADAYKHEDYATECLSMLMHTSVRNVPLLKRRKWIFGLRRRASQIIQPNFTTKFYNQQDEMPEGVSWGQKWYSFGMLLGYGSPNLHVSSSALICRFQCSWAWNVPARATCLSSRGVNLTFWAAICCIWPASAPNPVIFSVWSLYNKLRSLQEIWGKKTKWLARCAN